MSALELDKAPVPSLPLRFLLSALAWGVFAGLWLACSGPALFQSRWLPAAVVFVHAYTLGVMGNAMLGSLIQFLPVAVGSPLSGTRFMPLLHVLFNTGLLLLMAALMFPHPVLSAWASALLLMSIGTFAVAALVAVCRGAGPFLLRMGIFWALLCLLVTAALGALLLAVLSGHLALPLGSLADLHVTFGLSGWVVTLTASVAVITLPMFQGTRTIPGHAFLAWLALVIVVLSLTMYDVSHSNSHVRIVWLSLPGLAFCLTVWILQWRSPHQRNPTLRKFWSLGCGALTAACLVALWPTWLLQVPAANVAGVLVIAIGLPWLLLGMLLEITSFLCWLELRRRQPRGVRVPGVDRLLPEALKHRLLLAHAIAAMLLLTATARAAPAWLAGIALALAYAITLTVVCRCWRGACHYIPAAAVELGRKAA